MKRKRFGALFLALTLLLSLLTISANAAFSDIRGHWAQRDIEIMVERGVVKGVGGDSFAPDRKMTACEALLFCSRTTGVSAGDRARIAMDRSRELRTLLPEDMYPWAYEEMAVCLETGILTVPELSALTASGDIRRAISRENMALYLVRAMQLDGMARRLPAYRLNFSDAYAVAPSLQRYVYVLNTYGIVQGNQNNEFMPQGSIGRAEMTTMLRRAMDFMAEKGIAAELPAYTDYNWVGGTVASVNGSGTFGRTTLLTLNSELDGSRTLSLPEGTPIYRDNMKTSAADIRVGEYVRVNLDWRNNAQSVRLGGTLETFSGTVNEVTPESISVTVGGQVRHWDLDRFTRVQAGKTVGGPESIDLKAGYTSAVCQVDELGHLSVLKLTGGSYETEGLLTGIATEPSGGKRIQVTAFNGETTHYLLPVGATVTVNGLVSALQNNHLGCGISMRAANDNSGQLLSLNVDTATRYVQGSISNYSTSRGVTTLILQDLSSGRLTSYTVMGDAVVRYQEQEINLFQLPKQSFATLRLVGGNVAQIDAYPGSSAVEGQVETISYGSPIVLSVRKSDGSLLNFELPLDALPTIYRNNRLSSVEQLRTGDTVSVAVRYHRVTEISATAPSANVNGTITKVVQDSNGVILELKTTGQETVTYNISASVSVTQNGTVSNIYALRVGDRVAMVVNGSEVISIEVSQSASNGNTLTGTVLLTNNGNGTIILKPEDGNPVTVDAAGASFMSTDGRTISILQLQGNDVVTVYGGYEGPKFKATLVVKQA